MVCHALFSSAPDMLKCKSLFLALIPLGLGLLGSCNNTETPAASESTESLERSVGDPTVKAEETTYTGKGKDLGDESSSVSTSTKVDLASIIGTREDGWLPKVLAPYEFERGMSPEEVGKIMSGAEKISEFGFSEVSAKDIPGVDKYKFSFLKDKSDPTQKRTLYSISILFDPSIQSELPYDAVASAFADKYGEVEPQTIEAKIVTWGGPNSATAQLTNSVKRFEGYEFKIVIPKF